MSDDDYEPELVPLDAYDDEVLWDMVATRVEREAQAVLQDDWERRQAEGTHGETEQEEEPFRSRLLSVAQVLQLAPPPPLIGDWLDLGMLAEMPGKYGSLKSFAAMSMCLSVATGRPWLGEHVHQTGPAIYCSLEGAYTLGPRYAGWLEANRLKGADQLHTWGDRLNVLDDRHVMEFGGLLAEVKPLLVVIDTLSKATPGAEENGSEYGSAVYTAMAHFRDCSGGTVLAVHHSGHSASGRGRGHSSLEDDIDVVISFTGQWKDGPVLMKSEKQKSRENPPPKWVGLESTRSGHPVLVPTVDRPDDEVDVKPLVLAMVAKYPSELTKADLTRSDSRGHIDHPRAKVRDAVAALISEGRIHFEKHRRDGDRQERDVLTTTTAASKDSPRRPSSSVGRADALPTPPGATDSEGDDSTAAVVKPASTRGNTLDSADGGRGLPTTAAVVEEF